MRLPSSHAGPPDLGVGRLYNPRKRRQRYAQVPGEASAAAAAAGLADMSLAAGSQEWLDDVPSTSVEFYEQVRKAEGAY